MTGNYSETPNSSNHAQTLTIEQEHQRDLRGFVELVDEALERLIGVYESEKPDEIAHPLDHEAYKVRMEWAAQALSRYLRSTDQYREEPWTWLSQ